MKQNLLALFVIMFLCTSVSFAQTNCDNIITPTIDILSLTPVYLADKLYPV